MAKRGSRRPWRIRFTWTGGPAGTRTNTETRGDRWEVDAFLEQLRSSRDGWHRRGDTDTEVSWHITHADDPSIDERGTTSESEQPT